LARRVLDPAIADQSPFSPFDRSATSATSAFIVFRTVLPNFAAALKKGLAEAVFSTILWPDCDI